MKKQNLIICGDFNIHWDNKTAIETRKMMDMLDSFGLSQHINDATHTQGHTLDWLISRKEQNCIIKQIKILWHFLVFDLKAFSFLFCHVYVSHLLGCLLSLRFCGRCCASVLVLMTIENLPHLFAKSFMSVRPLVHLGKVL